MVGFPTVARARSSHVHRFPPAESRAVTSTDRSTENHVRSRSHPRATHLHPSIHPSTQPSPVTTYVLGGFSRGRGPSANRIRPARRGGRTVCVTARHELAALRARKLGTWGFWGGEHGSMAWGRRGVWVSKAKSGGFPVPLGKQIKLVIDVGVRAREYVPPRRPTPPCCWLLFSPNLFPFFSSFL